jgi:hypothetical protein
METPLRNEPWPLAGDAAASPRVRCGPVQCQVAATLQTLLMRQALQNVLAAGAVRDVMA